MDKETRSDGIAGLIVLALGLLFFMPPLFYVLRGENLFSTNNTMNFLFSAIATVSLSAPLIFIFTWARVALRDWHKAYKAECGACQSRHCKLTGHTLAAYSLWDGWRYTCKRCNRAWKVSDRKFVDDGLSSQEIAHVVHLCKKFLQAGMIASWWLIIKVHVAAKISAIAMKPLDNVTLIHKYLEKSEGDDDGKE